VQLAAAAGIRVEPYRPPTVQVVGIARDLARDEREAREVLTAATGEIAPGAVVPDLDQWVNALLALARAQAREALWHEVIAPRLAPARIEIAVDDVAIYVTTLTDIDWVYESWCPLPPTGSVPVARALAAEASVQAAVRHAIVILKGDDDEDEVSR